MAAEQPIDAWERADDRGNSYRVEAAHVKIAKPLTFGRLVAAVFVGNLLFGVVVAILYAVAH